MRCGRQLAGKRYAHVYVHVHVHVHVETHVLASMV